MSQCFELLQIIVQRSDKKYIYMLKNCYKYMVCKEFVSSILRIYEANKIQMLSDFN